MIRIAHRDRLAPRRRAPTLILPRLEVDAPLYVGDAVVEARGPRIVVTVASRPLERGQRLVEARRGAPCCIGMSSKNSARNLVAAMASRFTAPYVQPDSLCLVKS